MRLSTLRSRRSVVPAKTRSAGFSLIELLIVLALLGAMVTVGMSNLLATQQRHATEKAAEEVASFRDLARTAAIRAGRTVQMRIDYERGRFWVEASGDTVVTPRGLSATSVVIEGSADPICFDARGIATAAGSCSSVSHVIRFSHGSSTARLEVGAGGQAEVTS